MSILRFGTINRGTKKTAAELFFQVFVRRVRFGFVLWCAKQNGELSYFMSTSGT